MSLPLGACCCNKTVPSCFLATAFVMFNRKIHKKSFGHLKLLIFESCIHYFAGTVFDEVLCVCNFPSEVYEPCGTKQDDGNKPTERGCPLD